jgi:hypothetical protein
MTRAMLGLVVLLASAPLGSAAIAADWDGDARAAHHYAGVHRHHMHHEHHHRHAGTMTTQRRVLYRNPAYGARWTRRHPVATQGWNRYQRGHAAYPHGYGYGVGGHYGYPVHAGYGAVGYTYRPRVAGSYVGGGLLGALFNQPNCYCR